MSECAYIVGNDTHIFDCCSSANLSADWNEFSQVNGTVDFMVFDNKYCYKFDAPDGRARIINAVGFSLSSTTVIEIGLYIDTFGGNFQIQLYGLANANFLAYFNRTNNGLYYYTGSTYENIGPNAVVSGTWQRWTFEINWDGANSVLESVYLDDVLLASDKPFNWLPGGTSGVFYITQYYSAPALSYLYYVKVGNGYVNKDEAIAISSTNSLCYAEPYLFNASNDGIEILDTTIDSNYPVAYISDKREIKLLLNMEDVALSDSSLYQHEITLYNGAARSPGQYKFGSYSAYFDGSNDYVRISRSRAFNFGTDDFTVDFWFYWTDTSANHDGLISAFPDGGFSMEIDDEGGSSYKMRTLVYYEDNPTASGGYANTVITTNTWHHAALVRYGNSFTYYYDGDTDGISWTSSERVRDNVLGFLIGRYSFSVDNNFFFKGYIDALRISNFARWTTTFVGNLPPEPSIPESQVNAITIKNDVLYLATQNDGVQSFPISNVSGTEICSAIGLTNYVSDYKKYPYITDNEVKDLSFAGDYMCVVTTSGVDHFNLGSSDSYYRSFATASGVQKCWQTSTGKFYYMFFDKLITIYNHMCDWDESSIGYTYETGGVGNLFFPDECMLNDLAVIERTSIYGTPRGKTNNLLFLATTSGVVMIEERQGDEENSRYKQYTTASGSILKGTSDNFVAITAEDISTFDSPSFNAVSHGAGAGLNVVYNDQLKLFWESTVSGTGNTIRQNASDLDTN